MNREGEIVSAIRAEFGADIEYQLPEMPVRDSVKRLSIEAGGGRSLAVLVPAATETRWFHSYCFPWEVRFLRGRVRTEGYTRQSPAWPPALVIMGPLARRGYVVLWNLATGWHREFRSGLTGAHSGSHAKQTA